MATHDRSASVAVGEPDVGFQAGFGFYLGLVVTGIVAIAGLVAGATTATLLGVLPSTVTAVAIVGHIVASRAHGLPERIGGSRWRRLACYVPPAAFAGTLLGYGFAPSVVTERFAVVAIVLVLLTGVAAYGVDRMARNRYVTAVAADEPAATWSYHRVGFGSGESVVTAFTTLLILAGVLGAWYGNARGLVWSMYGLVMLLSIRFNWGGTWNSFDPSDRWNPPEIRAHEAGLVIDRAHAKKFVPWADVEDVRLTDAELVLERRWLNLRCDRSAIDDPDSVREAIDRVRSRAETHGSRAVETAD
ncbi:PH domain-containing protein [Halosolutus amylolyticus]|uniref:PH domain-containing protein n=1 Tax=Halosolutus amylolyticus TaxID=2932267 RepID=A0ABD5PTA1_9EURY|nr:PH domain-containing protein [Halosolutus amylolyticus]